MSVAKTIHTAVPRPVDYYRSLTFLNEEKAYTLTTGGDDSLPLFAMERIWYLPPHRAQAIHRAFFPPQFHRDDYSFLSRIYLGKRRATAADPSSKRFFTPNNFPLGIDDLRQVSIDPLPLAWSMGALLAVMHWYAHQDARDVEFVLAGDPLSDDVHLKVLDFNQVKEVGQEGVVDDALLGAMRANDPYYPRGGDDDNEILRAFTDVYLKTAELCTTDAEERAMAAEVMRRWGELPPREG
jgi:hypothetical protein